MGYCVIVNYLTGGTMERNLNNHKKNLQSIFAHLEKLEIRGSDNILLMYNIMGFIQQEIRKLEEEEKSPPEQED